MGTRGYLIYLSLLVLQACGPDPDVCVTPAGMRAFGEGLDCELLVRSEAIALLMLSIDPTQVKGWNLNAAAEEKLPDPGNRYPYVGGLTYCEYGYMVVGNMSSGMKRNGYAHELAHLRECKVVDYDDPHGLWGEPGDPNSVWSEVERVQRSLP